MSTKIIDSLRELNSRQQQTIIDLLVKIQDGKQIKPSDIGLLSYSVEEFPVTKFYELFSFSTPLGKYARCIVAEHPIQPLQTVNLKLLLEHIVKREVERLLNIELERNQPTMLDIAGVDEDCCST